MNWYEVAKKEKTVLYYQCIWYFVYQKQALKTFATDQANLR